MLSKDLQLSSVVVSFALLTAMMWGQTAQAPEPTAGMAPAAATQAPPTQLEITYTDSQLTIKAERVPLIDVLRLTCKRIGAELDAQAQPTDLVSGTFGPGNPKNILDGLLAGAHLNYALGATTEDPNRIANVTISPQSADRLVSTEASQEQTVQPQDTSTTTAPVRSASSQLLELIEAARPELAAGVNLDQNLAGGSDLADGGKQFDVTAVVQQIEQHIKSAEQSASTNTSQNQQADSANSDASGINSDVVHPRHRSRHHH